MKKPLPAGKLPPELLRDLLLKLPSGDPRVLTGPCVGEDAAVIDMGDRCLVAKTDPITFAVDRIGWYLVNINANDLACLGAKPRWLLVTCLLPEGATAESDLAALFEDLASACNALNITICGGHTEITLGLERPILVGQMLGEVDRGRFVDKSRVAAGDLLLMTKGVAIEGTCVLARECSDYLMGKLPREIFERSLALLTDPGVSVIRDAEAALEAGRDFVHGLHDPTEGGLLQGVWELAMRGGTGVWLECDNVPVLPETQAMCELFHIDPLGLLASGTLLIAVDPGGEHLVQEGLARVGIACVRIGEMRSVEEGRICIRDGKERALGAMTGDELIRGFRKGKGNESSKSRKKIRHSR